MNFHKVVSKLLKGLGFAAMAVALPQVAQANSLILFGNGGLSLLSPEVGDASISGPTLDAGAAFVIEPGGGNFGIWLSGGLFFQSVSDELGVSTISSLGFSPSVGVSLKISSAHVRLRTGYDLGILSSLTRGEAEGQDISFSRIPLLAEGGFNFGAFGVNLTAGYVMTSYELEGLDIPVDFSGFNILAGVQYDLFHKKQKSKDRKMTRRKRERKRSQRRGRR